MINSLLNFIESVPTPYHLAEAVKKELPAKEDLVFLQRGGLVVFYHKKEITPKTRFHIWGAHSDSPALKIRSNPNRQKNNLSYIKTEIYGGPIINTWLDRSLGLAGKVYYQKDGQVLSKIVNFAKPLFVVPNAAIHINREINKGFKINKEKNLGAIFNLKDKKLEYFLGDELNISPRSILSYDLQLYPLESPTLLGSGKEFIHSPRLDNLLMCHAGLAGFLGYLKEDNHHSDVFPLVIFFNHEEIGSRSDEGAHSIYLKSLLDKILVGVDINLKSSILEKSFFISADVAHTFHPEYSDLYEDSSPILFDNGVVLKYSSNRHYVSEGKSMALIKNLLLKKQILFQESNNHGEIPSGSTIGPIVNSNLGMSTVDLGSSLLAMHSAKELGSVKDHEEITKLAKNFFNKNLEN